MGNRCKERMRLVVMHSHQGQENAEVYKCTNLNLCEISTIKNFKRFFREKLELMQFELPHGPSFANFECFIFCHVMHWHFMLPLDFMTNIGEEGALGMMLVS